MFDALVMGKAVDMANHEVKEHVQTYNYVMLADRFGWTPKEIMELPQQFYNDCILIISKQNTYQEQEMKKAQKKHKYK